MNNFRVSLLLLFLGIFLVNGHATIGQEIEIKESKMAKDIAEYCLRFGEKDKGGYVAISFQTTPPVGKRWIAVSEERLSNMPIDWMIRVADRAPIGTIGKEDMLEIKIKGLGLHCLYYVYDNGLDGRGYFEFETPHDEPYSHIYNHLMYNTGSMSGGFKDKPSKVTERSLEILKTLKDLGTSIQDLAGGGCIE